MTHRPDIDEKVAALARQHYVIFGAPFATRESFVKWNAATIKSVPNMHAVEPKEDAAGNCVVCGEAGRCPGVHAIEWL